MAIDADHRQISAGGGSPIERRCVLDRYTEFALGKTRGDVRMGLGSNVGIHAKRHWRDLPQPPCHLIEHEELLGRLHVEAANTDFERPRHLTG